VLAPQKDEYCRGCALEHLGNGFMRPEGKGVLKVAVVAEALGANEAKDGLPLRPYAQSGAMFERVIKRLGYTRDQFAIANIVWCQPPRNELVGANYEAEAISKCRPHLDKFFDTYRPNVVVSLGNTPTSQLTGLAGKKLGVTSIRGFAIDSPHYNFTVVPTYHPSFLSRGMFHLVGAMMRDVKFAVEIAQHGLKRPVPEFSHIPSREEVEEFIRLLKFHPEWFVQHDVETVDSMVTEDESEVETKVTQLTQVQVMTDAGIALVMPWEEPYRTLFKQIMALPNPKASWNGWEFDNYRYQENDVTVNGVDHDIMWAWHHWQPDLPRGLQFATSFFVPGAIPWKHIHAENPGLYGWCDVHHLREDRQAIFAALDKNGLRTAYDRHVVELRSILLRMGERGLPIDPQRKKEFGEYLVAESTKLRDSMQPLIPDEIRRVHPKNGYVKPPTDSEPCPDCDGTGHITDDSDEDEPPTTSRCLTCNGKGEVKFPDTSGLIEREFLVPNLKQYTPCVHCNGKGTVTVTQTSGKPRKGWVRRVEEEKCECSINGNGGCVRCFGTGVLEFVTYSHSKETKCAECKGKGQIETGRGEGRVKRWARVLPFNPSSPDQVKDYIRWMAKKWPKKGYRVPKKIDDDSKETTAKDELKRLAKKTKDPVLPMVVDFKEYDKLRSSYDESWVLGEDNAVHARFSTKPATGQLAAFNPNIFTIPKRGDKAYGFRYQIMAPQNPERRVLVEIDYTAAHALTLGFEAEDPLYMNVARNDIHGFVTMFSKKKPERDRCVELALNGTPEALKELKQIIKHYRSTDEQFEYERNFKSKPAILGIGFKMGVNKLYKMNRETYANLAEAQSFKDILAGLFPKILSTEKVNGVSVGFQDRVCLEGYTKGYLKSRGGYIRWFWDVYHWDPKDQAMRQGEDAEKCVAFRPANDAFCTMKDALLRMESKGLLERFSLRNVVHDAVMFCPMWKDVEECLTLAKQELEAPVPYLSNSTTPPEGLRIFTDANVGIDMKNMYGLDKYQTEVEKYYQQLIVTVTPKLEMKGELTIQ
jgi:uracil-DNA glycosylase family 4